MLVLSRNCAAALTESGVDVLSAAIPRAADDVEAWVSAAKTPA